MLVLKEYIENGKHITEYTSDGKTVSHRVEVPAQSDIPNSEVLPVPQLETTDQKITRLEQQIQSDNLIIFEALAEIYAATVGGTE